MSESFKQLSVMSLRRGICGHYNPSDPDRVILIIITARGNYSCRISLTETWSYEMKWWLWLSHEDVFVGGWIITLQTTCLSSPSWVCLSLEPCLPAFHTPGALAISPAVAVPTALVSSCFLSLGMKSQRQLFISPLWQPYYYKLIIGLLVLDSFSSTVTRNNWRGDVTVSMHLLTAFSV